MNEIYTLLGPACKYFYVRSKDYSDKQFKTGISDLFFLTGYDYLGGNKSFHHADLVVINCYG